MDVKIKLKSDVRINNKDGVMTISNDKNYFQLNEAEQMIINHHENFSLKEIMVILREFFQIEQNKVNDTIDGLINMLQKHNMIDLVDSNNSFDLDETHIYKKNTDIELIIDNDGTGILRDFNKGKMLFLNASGIEIWDYICEDHSIAQIIDYISKIYGMNKETICKDVKDFMISLAEKNYIN